MPAAQHAMRILGLTPARIIILGFLALILLGACLLDLPASSADGRSIGFTDALYTAVSSVCVTGLVVVDTNTHWSPFGKIVILALIQIGALGVMSVVALFSIITGRTLGLRQRIAIQESLGHYKLSGILSVFRKVLAVTLAIEAAGAALLCIPLIPEYGWLPGIGKSVFLSVSAFCNAGVDLFGTAGAPFSSLTGFSGNGLLLLTTACLAIVGGLGYIVWMDAVYAKRFRKLRLHSKIVLLTTLALLALGTAGYFFLEADASMGGMPAGRRLLNSFFHSASARTAGFNTVDMGGMSDAGSLLTIVLMFIGGAPGSTAGGIKVTTIFVLVMTVGMYIRGRRELHVCKRTLADRTITRAVAIFMVSFLVVLASTFLLLANGEGRFHEAFTESVSAFGTVGLTKGITPGLGAFSKYQLMVTMLVGRIGTITAVAVFTSAQAKDTRNYRYPDEEILVG